jgi:hypothetical protein
MTDWATIVLATHATNDTSCIQHRCAAAMSMKSTYTVVAQNTLLSSAPEKDAAQPKAQLMWKEICQLANMWHVGFCLSALLLVNTAKDRTGNPTQS